LTPLASRDPKSLTRSPFAITAFSIVDDQS
jgi:hypothetical protein